MREGRYGDGEFHVGGLGKLQLEIVMDRLKREFGITAAVGKPRIVYREAIRYPSEGEAKYAQAIGGHGHYAEVKLRLFPRKIDTGYEFQNALIGGAVPARFVPAIRKGIDSARSRGVVAGHPIDDVTAQLYDGSYHDVDSSEEAFAIAAAIAFESAARKGHPILLEPS
jgi:elongation factor G